MGAYINPKNETKEDFLNREGVEVAQLSWENKPVGTLPVILVDNAIFTAAAIAYSKMELSAFVNPSDHRKKQFYYVSLEKLRDVSDIDSYL